MKVVPTSFGGAKIEGVYACLPSRCVDNRVFCRERFGDAARADSVVKATGIETRRVADSGISAFDLSCAAAERLLSDLARARGESDESLRASIGAIIDVSFTRAARMPAEACRAQARLGLPADVLAFDVSLACSGYVYALELAASLLPGLGGKRVLVLDGDVQTPFVASDDTSAAPVLSDAGTATLIAPDSAAVPWRFASLTVGAEGDALVLGPDGRLRMDGFGVFRFVSTSVTDFLRAFLESVDMPSSQIAAFVPHQANVYMIRQLAKALGIDEARLLISADKVGNPASASVPVTIARDAEKLVPGGVTLLVGFGGGLSAAVCSLVWPEEVLVSCFDYER